MFSVGLGCVLPARFVLVWAVTNSHQPQDPPHPESVAQLTTDCTEKERKKERKRDGKKLGKKGEFVTSSSFLCFSWYFHRTRGLLWERERPVHSDINQLNAPGLILARMLLDIAPRALHAYPVCNGSHASMVGWREVIYVLVYGRGGKKKKRKKKVQVSWGRDKGMQDFTLSCFFGPKLKATTDVWCNRKPAQRYSP